MGELAQVVLVGGVALLASTIAGVTGFGGAVLLLPALVWAVGARDAVVVLTVAQLVGNGSRVLWGRSDLNRPLDKTVAATSDPTLAPPGVDAVIDDDG